MHFLSHYYTELPENDPLFVVGLMIPDLTPKFTKIYNSIIVKHALPTSSALKQIQKGIVQHFGADKRFHHSKLFLQQVSSAIQSFTDAGLSRERLRLSVIAHITVEMMIDRQIMIEKPGVCEDYYRLIGEADEAVLNNYFTLFGLEAEKKKFLLSFQFFKQRRFLFLFSDLEKIVLGLNRVYGSAAKTEFTETEKRKFVVALHNIDIDMRYSWQEILNDNL